jgi:hypothetical protein
MSSRTVSRDVPPAHYGLAVATGRLAKYARWVPQDLGTTIDLALTGDNYHIHLGVWYTSIGLGWMLERATEKDKRSGF